MKSAAVIQAAGKGSRFHSDQYKLLTPINGKPMILRTIEPVLEAGFDEIIVVIGSHAKEMRACLQEQPVQIIQNNEWEKGQSTSLSAGIKAVMDNSDRACLLLGDQPFLQTETLQQLLISSEQNLQEIIVPFYKEKRGNPIIVPAMYYGQLLDLTRGDMGGKKLLEMVGYHRLDISDPGILHDIDTVEELKKYE